MSTILSMSWPSGIITYFQKDGTKMALKDWTVLKLKHSCEVWACSTAAGDCELLSSLPRWAPVRPLQTSPLRIKPNLSIPLYTIGSKLFYPSTHPYCNFNQAGMLPACWHPISFLKCRECQVHRCPSAESLRRLQHWLQKTKHTVSQQIDIETYWNCK